MPGIAPIAGEVAADDAAAVSAGQGGVVGRAVVKVFDDGVVWVACVVAALFFHNVWVMRAVVVVEKALVPLPI